MSTPLPYHPELGQHLRAAADPADRPCWLRLDGGRRELFGMAPTAGLVLTNQPISGTSESDVSYISHWSDFWTGLPSLLANAPSCADSGGSRFRGGIMGYIGYGPAPGAQPRVPVAWMGVYPWFIHIDHILRKATFVTPDGTLGHREVPTSWHRLLEYVNSITRDTPASPGRFRLTGPFQPLTSRARYGECFARIQEYLHSGDCYQVNFTQAFRAGCEGPSAAAMERLLATSNAGHAAWLAMPTAALEMPTTPDVL